VKFFHAWCQKKETLIGAKDVFGKNPLKNLYIKKKSGKKEKKPTTPFPRTTPWKKEKKRRKLNP